MLDVKRKREELKGYYYLIRAGVSLDNLNYVEVHEFLELAILLEELTGESLRYKDRPYSDRLFDFKAKKE